jgi:hypothetical protein
MHIFKALLAFLILVVADGSPIGINTGYLPTDLLRISKELNNMQLGNCSDINATLPLDKTEPQLPPPSPELSLKYVVLGRGTQNYSCPCPEKSPEPTTVGALATLFDASCLAETHPSLLHELPGALSNAPVEALSFMAVLTGQIASPDTGGLIPGKHYFNGAGVPTFDMRFGGSEDWMTTELAAKAPPPSKGSAVAKNGKGQNVKWLKLTATGGKGIQVSICPSLFTSGI